MIEYRTYGQMSNYPLSPLGRVNRRVPVRGRTRAGAPVPGHFRDVAYDRRDP